MLQYILLMRNLKNLKIIVDGNEIDIQAKWIMVDALLEKARLDPLKNRLMLVDAQRKTIVEFCCLADIIEIFEDMTFITRCY